MVNLPQNSHFIIMSRIDAGIGSRKPALQGEYLHIGEQALRFSEEEVYKLLVENYKVRMDSSEIHSIYEYAEGWIAGVNMLAHAAAGRYVDLDDMPVGENIHHIFDYLLGEALKGLNTTLKKNLTQISLLSDFTCEALHEVFNIENAAGLIDHLENNNIFTHKVKAEVPTYRYHPLFRSALQTILTDLFTKDEIENMRLRAAQYFQKTGDFASASAFLLNAGHICDAVNLAVTEGIKYVDAGNVESRCVNNPQFYSGNDPRHPRPVVFIWCITDER